MGNLLIILRAILITHNAINITIKVNTNANAFITIAVTWLVIYDLIFVSCFSLLACNESFMVWGKGRLAINFSISPASAISSSTFEKSTSSTF